MNRIAISALVSAVICMAGAAMALDFSADVVSEGQGQKVTGKMFVSGEKVRMEMAGVTTISRIDKKVVWVIMPGENMYMEQPFEPEKVAGATEKMPGEVERVDLGPDTVDGRQTTKYRITYESKAGRNAVLQWVDRQTNIPLRTASEDGKWSMEYRNIDTRAPDASLFEIPDGYKKFSMPDVGAMMRDAMKSVNDQ